MKEQSVGDNGEESVDRTRLTLDRDSTATIIPFIKWLSSHVTCHESVAAHPYQGSGLSAQLVYHTISSHGYRSPAIETSVECHFPSE